MGCLLKGKICLLASQRTHLMAFLFHKCCHDLPPGKRRFFCLQMCMIGRVRLIFFRLLFTQFSSKVSIDGWIKRKNASMKRVTTCIVTRRKRYWTLHFFLLSIRECDKFAHFDCLEEFKSERRFHGIPKSL